MPDWEEIQKGYEAGETYAALARTFMVPYATVRSRALREGWRRAKKSDPPEGILAAAGALAEHFRRMLEDEMQFNRYLIKVKGENGEDYEERICRKADVKAMLDVAGAIKSLAQIMEKPSEEHSASGVIVLPEASEHEE